MKRLPIGILGSGKGSNCRAIFERIRSGDLAAEARLVVSDVLDAPILDIARAFGVANAYLSPGKVGARDLTRSLTFRAWNDRSCKLANALVGLGLEKGDRIAVLAYNCLEWMEIYAAVAKAGLVIVPINFRLIGSEVRYIVENSEANAVFVQDDLLDRVETIRAERLIAEDKYIHFGGRTPPGYRS